jgi:hypothetical protein
MSTTNEPRALSAALSGPAFATRGGGAAMHAADRHVERWAPETSTGTNRSRPMRNLGFVDRLISPWVEAAQRSASLRLFNQYATSGMGESQGKAVSWVFPRPWYQDELDWMAAARRAPLEQSGSPSPTPSLFTTRGTYVAPAQQPQQPSAVALSPALYEYVAPSLSVAAPTATPGTGYGGETIERRAGQAFSPIIPLAAVQAADVMARTVSRLPATVAAAPALRSVLSTLLQRTTAQSMANEVAPTRLAMQAPELVTPPSPREDLPAHEAAPSMATTVADRAAQQHAQIADLQRIARQSAVQREVVAAAQQAQQQAAAQQAAAQQAAAPTIAAPTPAPAAQTREQQVKLVEEARRAHAEAQQQVEDRVARRVAERSAQRLHEQARAEAAVHARTAVEPSITAPIAPVASAPAPTSSAPPEVAAAIASLPPELAAMLSRRPERAAQTISELDHAYRAVELMARNAAAGGSFEVTRGPRLMMPAGLGGLVAAVEQAPTMSRAAGIEMSAPMMTMPGVVAQQEAMQERAAAMQQRTVVLQQRAEAARVRTPALPWIASPSAGPGAPTSALGATAHTTPAALSHVAWSDRWLARFAGASTQSLDTLTTSTSSSDARSERMPRILGLASSAPGSVFVSPTFDAVRDAETVRVDSRGHVTVSAPPPFVMPSLAPAPIAMPAAPGAGMTSAASTADVVRYDDDAETPDDVFAAISASASQRRAVPASAPAPSILSAAAAAAVESDRPSVADTIAHASPQSPSAGLAAQLAASPFAPALRHVLSIPSATSFDVRALFGGALSTSYLSGLLAPESHEIEVATRALPSWAAWTSEPATPSIGERAAPAWDAAYVSPESDRALEASIATGSIAAPTAVPYTQAALAAATAPLTTVRSALLSWEADIAATPMTATGAAASAPSFTSTGEMRARPIGTARELIDAMSLPLLGDVEPSRNGESWAAPGMVAERAHGFSIAQERSSADLSFDFVPPELVLAARVYGLGPAEAAQAMRLAIVGPGQLSAMAGTVDRTFVQAMQFESDRRERSSTSARLEQAAAATRVVPQTAYPTTSGDLAVAARLEAAAATQAASVQATQASSVQSTQAQATPMTFGVERRTPRGAFLWPQATVAALKLDAASPDGQQSMSIAALELLAAQSVAELGTYAALGEPSFDASGAGEAASLASIASFASPTAATSSASSSPTSEYAVPGVAQSSAEARAELAEPDEADVLQAATALVPESRRARFEALYLALGRSPSSVGISPAARAARALALAGRGEDAPLSARERAASAWDVLPAVYAVELGEAASAMAYEAMGGAALTGGARARAAARAGAREHVAVSRDYAQPEMGAIDVRPGLSSLSYRAGEALSSYVAPSSGTLSATTPSSSSASSSSSSPTFEREVGALLRVPTAAQEMVQTGRPSGRFGGGEVEIPTWFEAAARKMFESQSGSMGDGISMADLTLIAAAPSNQIAASSRGTHTHSASVSPGAAGNAEPKPGQKVDIEKIANEIYRQILAMMDAARARNGEPYL